MGERFQRGRMYRGSSRVLSQPETGFPGPAAFSPKASDPLSNKPSQEAAGERERETELRE